MGIERVTSSTPCLIWVMRVERSLLKNASGSSKLTSVQDRMSVKLQNKLGGCMSVKTKPFMRLQSVRGHGPGGLKLILGPGVFTVFDLHKMDVPLFGKELARVADLGSRGSGGGRR
eukprot:1154495-Pelagomonas_calceolata.AAC.5